MKRTVFVCLAAVALPILLLTFGRVLTTADAAKPTGRLRTGTDIKAPQPSTSIVISTVYGGGGSASGFYTKDFVELKNISSSTQSLNGLSLYYGSSTGQFASSTSNAFALPNVTLQPGQYYLVTLGSVGTGGASIPTTADADTTNLSMSGTGGKIALVNGLTQNSCGATATPCSLPNAQIIDLVSYGSTNNAEGGAATAALSTTTAAVRKGAGCTDTDNNSADFDIVTVSAPRNSSSTYTACGAGTSRKPNLDFNGDGKTDYTVTRNNGGNKVWYTSLNGSGTFSGIQWGLTASDWEVPADFDGDGKADVAVWRQPSSGEGAFYILRSSDSTVQTEPFGQAGDDPSVTADYDGDGKADPAVFRCPSVSAGQCYFYYRGSLNNSARNITFVPWGLGFQNSTQSTIRSAPGDYDGDGKGDFCVFVNGGGGAGMFILLKSSNLGVEYVPWGLATDLVIPRGDFDGDGKTDFAVTRLNGSNYNIYTLTRTGGGTGASPYFFGASGDEGTLGDYDGDGKTDIAVWRPSNGTFFVLNSSTNAVTAYPWGLNGDVPVANWILPNGQ